ncbi:winged helix-turn-helix domain-containing protein [Halalkalicoccus tibetensis]|uniref:ArsR/SmtB family transcription factor n=1 Tax=Halalkalicoccus tibetensis TaxID=175632 RepID=A0ABD5V0P2_9EURY
MERILYYLLTGMRGGTNRIRIIRSLLDRPKNANQLAEELDLNYKTVRHHLDMLEEHDIVLTYGDTYGEMYFLTDEFDAHRETFDRIAEGENG